MIPKQSRNRQVGLLIVKSNQRCRSPSIKNSNLIPNQEQQLHRRSKSKNRVSSIFNQSSNQRKSLVQLIDHTLTQNEMNILSNCTNINIDPIAKSEPVLPYLTKSSAVAKFIIRGYRPVDETAKYITSTKIKEKISSNFFDLKEIARKQQLMQRLEFFEKNKKGSIYEKEESNVNQRLMHTMPDIGTITDENEILRDAKIKEEGKNLADMVLSMDKYERMSQYDDDLNTNEISRINLHNVINRRKIMKAKGKFDAEDHTLGINDIHQIKMERQITEYQLSKKTMNIGVPKFIKSKFLSDTTTKFKSVNGKYFGVIC